ncbi:MAG: plastocyanin/azurin family copper-binding protein [Dehalococcoidia bacterium]
MLKFVAAAALVSILFAGCSGSDDDDSAAPTQPAATNTAAATAAGTATSTGSAPSPTATAAATQPAATATSAPAATATQPPAPTATQAAPQPKTVTVQLGDQSYNPSSLTIRAGDTVQWQWGGDIPHSVTSRGGFTSDPAGIKSSGSYSFTFAAAGVYEYFCQVHEASGMTGTITVQ